jgi:hypothetical protein
MEISFEKVREIWNNARGKDTGGIREWFAPPITSKWTQITIKASDVGSLRCIGGYPARSPDGKQKVENIADVVEYERNFRWDANWQIIAARDPETSECVILDGNGRALQVYLAVKNCTMATDDQIGIVIGDLNLRIVRISKAISSLYC